MQNGAAKVPIAEIWRNYFYNHERDPPEWSPHPHCRFRPVGRFLAVFVGSIVPMGVMLLRTGVAKRLDEGSLQIGWTFWVIVVVAAVAWIIAVGLIAATEQKRMWRYCVAGVHPPAWGVLVFQMFQSYT